MTQSNAKKKTAAPDLLEALEDFVTWWDDWTGSTSPVEIADPDIEAAKAAIAKAKGA